MDILKIKYPSVNLRVGQDPGLTNAPLCLVWDGLACLNDCLKETQEGTARWHVAGAKVSVQGKLGLEDVVSFVGFSSPLINYRPPRLKGTPYMKRVRIHLQECHHLILIGGGYLGETI